MYRGIDKSHQIDENRNKSEIKRNTREATRGEGTLVF